MKSNGILFLILGIVILLGGTYGYLVKNSLPSLLGSSFLSIPLIFCGKKTLNSNMFYETLGLIFSSLACLFFSYRVIKTQNLLPSGIFVACATGVVLTVCVNIRKRITKNKDTNN